MYLVRVLNVTQFKAQLRDVLGEVNASDLEKFRQGLTANHYFFLNLKLVGVFAIVSKRRLDLKKLGIKYGVAQTDCRVLARMRSNSRTVGSMRKMTRAKWGGIVPKPTSVIRKCGALLRRIEKIVDRIVRRKLKFVTIFQGVSHHDLMADVRTRLIQQFYWAFEIRNNNPFHEERWAVQTVSRYITNLQYHWSAAKRTGATIRDGFGASHRKVILASEMRPRVTSSDVMEWSIDDTKDTLYQSVQSQEEQVASMAQSIDARNILLMYGTSVKKLKLLRVLAGIPHPKFDKWLSGQHVLHKGESHVELQERVSRVQFLSYAASWLGLRPKKVKAWLGKIRHDLDVRDTVVSVPLFRPTFTKHVLKTNRSLVA